MKQKYIKILATALIGMLVCLTGCGKRAESMTFDSDTGEIKSQQITETELSETSEVSSDDGLSTEEIDTVQSEEADVTETKVVTVEMPSWDYYIADDKASTGSGVVTLKETSKKANQITDDEEWFQTNGIQFPSNRVAPADFEMAEDLPGHVNASEGDLSLVKAMHNEEYYFCIYGANYGEGYVLDLYDVASESLQYQLDFSNYRYAEKYKQEDYEFIQQRIQWADTVDDILYVSIGHDTYAESSPQNAYIVAIDLRDCSVIWKSDPLMSNAYNFTTINDSIICGYGFTAEPDCLYILDRMTGKQEDKIPLKSMAEYIIQKDNILFVRTYDMDYTFSISE